MEDGKNNTPEVVKEDGSWTQQQYTISAGDPSPPQAAIELDVPGYPHKLHIKVELVPELAAELSKITDSEEKRLMAANVLLNMLFASLNAAGTEKDKSPLILPR